MLNDKNSNIINTVVVYKVITVVPDTYMLNIYYLLLSLLPFYIIILQLYLQSTLFIWKRFDYYSQGCYEDQVPW